MPSDAQIEIFKTLLGRTPTGPIWMGFTQGFDSDWLKGQLIIGDESGEPRVPSSWHVPPQVKGVVRAHEQTKKLRGRDFKMEFDEGTLDSFSTSDQKLFRVVYGGNEYSLPVPGFVMDGRIVWKDDGNAQRELTIRYTRNRGDDEYVRLLFKTNNRYQEFFRAHIFAQPFW
jgi:hypothetical protein